MKNEKLKELKNTFIPLTTDAAAKSIFHFDKSIIKEILSILLDMNVKRFEFLENETPTANINEYHLTTDLLFLVNDKLYVNIEINRTQFEIVKDKSLCYLAKFIALRVTRGDDIKNVENGIIQININAKTRKNELPEKTVVFYIKEEQKDFSDNIKMKLYDVEKFRDLYYNNNRDKKTILLTLFSARNKEEVEESVKKLFNKKKSELFMRRYSDMCKDPRIITAYEKEQTDKMVYYTSLENATNKGKFLGFIEGKILVLKKEKRLVLKKEKRLE